VIAAEGGSVITNLHAEEAAQRPSRSMADPRMLVSPSFETRLTALLRMKPG